MDNEKNSEMAPQPPAYDSANYKTTSEVSKPSIKSEVFAELAKKYIMDIETWFLVFSFFSLAVHADAMVQNLMKATPSYGFIVYLIVYFGILLLAVWNFDIFSLRVLRILAWFEVAVFMYFAGPLRLSITSDYQLIWFFDRKLKLCTIFVYFTLALVFTFQAVILGMIIKVLKEKLTKRNGRVFCI